MNECALTQPQALPGKQGSGEGLTVAVIGCGVIAPLHIAALQQIPQCARVVLVDKAQQRAADLAQRLSTGRPPSLTMVDTVSAALQAADVVHICTPHRSHFEIFSAALAADCHVLTEKPMAVHPAHLDAMERLAVQAEQRGVMSSCIFQHRFSALAGVLARNCATGRLGAIQEVDIRGRCTRTVDYYAKDSWRGTWAEEGGGLLINQMIHLVDLACHVLGPAVTVEAQVANRRLASSVEVEDWAQARIGFAGGFSGVLDCENDQTTDWSNLLRITTDVGTLVFTPEGGGAFAPGTDHPASAVMLAEAISDDAPSSAAGTVVVKREYGDLHLRQIQHFYRSLAHRQAPEPSISAAAMANRVVLACYQSARLGGSLVSLDSMDDYAPPDLH